MCCVSVPPPSRPGPTGRVPVDHQKTQWDSLLAGGEKGPNQVAFHSHPWFHLLTTQTGGANIDRLWQKLGCFSWKRWTEGALRIELIGLPGINSQVYVGK